MQNKMQSFTRGQTQPDRKTAMPKQYYFQLSPDDALE